MTDATSAKPVLLIGLSGGLYGLGEEPGAVPRLLLAGVQPTALAIDPSDPARIYCSTYNRGLWRSEDGGSTWRPAGTPQSYYAPPTDGAIGPRETTFVSVDPRPDAHGRHAVWVGTELSSLYRSDDHGETFRLATAFESQKSRGTWSFPPRPKTHHVRWIAHGDAGQVYVSIEFGALLRSLDGGATFEDRLPDSPLDTHVLRTHPNAPGRLYAALGDGLMQRGHSYAESHDGGATWRYLGEGFGDMIYLYGMAIDPADPDDIHVAASTGPRAAHGDNGPQWKSAARTALSKLHLAHDTDGPSSIFRREGDRWIEDAAGFPRDHSLVPVLATDPMGPGRWLALSNFGLLEKVRGAEAWHAVASLPEWVDMHPMCLTTTRSG
jgi:hypothetical protein